MWVIILKLFMNSSVSRIMCVCKHTYRNKKTVYRKLALHSTSNLSFQLRLAKREQRVLNFSSTDITFSYFLCANIHLRCEKGEEKSPLDGSSLARAILSCCLCRACLTLDASMWNATLGGVLWCVGKAVPHAALSDTPWSRRGPRVSVRWKT